MEFRQLKCQVFRITNKKAPIRIPYGIDWHQLEEVQAAKYMGDYDRPETSAGLHIFDKCAGRRTPPELLAEEHLKMQNQALGLVLQYTSSTDHGIWEHHMGPQTANNIGKLEMVQRRSSRFGMGDYRTTSSVTAMMTELRYQTLQERRAQAKVIMMCRIWGLSTTYSPERVPIQLGFRRFLRTWRISARKKCARLSKVVCRWWTLTFFRTWIFYYLEMPIRRNR